MNSVERLRLCFRKMYILHCLNAKSGISDHLDDVAGVACCNCVGLDHGERDVTCHGGLFC